MKIMFVVLICFTSWMLSQEGGYLGAIFNYGASARYFGMGNTAAAISGDASNISLNVGSLGFVDKKQLSLLYLSLWEKTGYTCFIYAHPTFDHSFAFSVVSLNSWDIEKRDIYNRLTGKIGFSQIGSMLVYGKKITEKISWGIASKFLYTSLDKYSRLHLSFDTGFMMEINHLFNLGINLQNVITTKLYGDTEDTMPFALRLGFGYKVLGDKLLISADIERNTTNRIFNYYSLGLESKIFGPFVLRLGNNINEFTAGFGFKSKPFDLDYALGLHHYLGLSHRISLNLRFGVSISEARLAKLKLEEEKRKIELERQKELEEKLKLEEQRKREEEYRTKYEEGILLYKTGYYAQALIKFSYLHRISPEDEAVKTIHDRLKNITPIMGKLIDPDRVAQLTRDSISSYIEGDFETAIRKLAYAVSIEPDNRVLSSLLTRLENLTGIKAERVSPLTEMSLVDTKLFNASIEFRKGNYEKVIQLCQEVIELEPDNALAYKRMGSAFYAMGDKEKAKSMWRKALSIKPDPKLNRFLETIK